MVDDDLPASIDIKPRVRAILAYLLPERAGGEKKKRTKRTKRVLESEKLSVDKIVDDYTSNCCRSCCLQNLLTLDEFIEARTLHWNAKKNNKERTMFHHNRLNSSYDCEGQASRNTQGKFRYTVAGKTVCQKAYVKSFGFSHGTLMKIQKNIRKDVNGALHAMPDREPSKSKSPEYGSMFGWFANYVNRLAETMPHTGKKILPPSSWKAIFEEYKKDFELDGHTTLGYSAFMKMKNNESRFSDVKLPNLGTMGLKSCNECRQLYEIMHRAKTSSQMVKFRLLRRDHLEKASRERELYWTRRELARQTPRKFVSIIIDGMDQHKTCLPYYPRKSADTKSKLPFKVHVAGIHI